MNTAVVNIKVDPKVKKQAKKVALELGFSLSALINAYLRQLIKTKTAKSIISLQNPSSTQTVKKQFSSAKPLR